MATSEGNERVRLGTSLQLAPIRGASIGVDQKHELHAQNANDDTTLNYNYVGTFLPDGDDGFVKQAISDATSTIGTMASNAAAPGGVLPAIRGVTQLLMAAGTTAYAADDSEHRMAV